MAAETSFIFESEVDIQKESHPCYQCGICSGSCPMARLDRYFNPRRMVVHSQLNRPDISAKNDAIWLCAGCFCCSFHCPNDVKVADIVAELREMAIKQGNVPLVIDESKCIG